RRAAPHEGDRAPVRPRGHSGQLGPPRPGRDADDRTASVGSGAVPAHAVADPTGPVRAGRGSRVRRPLSRVQRVVLGDRQRVGHRRRVDGAVRTDRQVVAATWLGMLVPTPAVLARTLLTCYALSAALHLATISLSTLLP